MSLPHWTFPQAHHYSCQAAELPPMGHKLGRPVIQSNCPHQVTVTRSISKTLCATVHLQKSWDQMVLQHCKGFQRLSSVTLWFSRHLYQCKDFSSKMCQELAWVSQKILVSLSHTWPFLQKNQSQQCHKVTQPLNHCYRNCHWPWRRGLRWGGSGGQGHLDEFFF